MSVFNPRFLAACAVLLSPTQSVLLVLSALHFVVPGICIAFCHLCPMHARLI